MIEDVDGDLSALTVTVIQAEEISNADGPCKRQLHLDLLQDRHRHQWAHHHPVAGYVERVLLGERGFLSG